MVELCSIEDCEREIVDEFCLQHLEAQKNLNEAFEKWVKAFGEKFSKDKYYSELLENDNLKTGQWVKDIILYQLDDDDS